MVQRRNTELVKVWLEKRVSWVNSSTVSWKTSGALGPKLGLKHGLTVQIAEIGLKWKKAI